MRTCPDPIRLRSLFLLGSLLAAGLAHADVFACKGADGGVTLQDQPCASSQVQVRKLESARQAPPANRGYAPAAAADSGRLPFTDTHSAPAAAAPARADGGNVASPLKRLLVHVYVSRCTAALAQTEMVKEWSAAQMGKFCRCVGNSLYDSQANMAGIKDVLLNKGRVVVEAANTAAQSCATGSLVPQWKPVGDS